MDDTKTGRDWLPWTVLAILGIAFAALVLLKPTPSPPLDEATAASGRPLTSEQQSVRYEHADLSFEIFPDSKSIEGRAVERFAVKKPIDRLQLDLDGRFEISEVTVNGQKTEEFTRDDGRVVVSFPQTAAGSTVEIGISYKGQPRVAERAPWDGGFVWSKTPDGKPWIATAVQGEGCDLFWPCADNPSAEFDAVDLHITVPEGLDAPSNGVLRSVDRHDDGRTTWNWHAKRINSYNIALNIAPYEELKRDYRSRYGNTIPMRFWYLQGNDDKAKRLVSEWPDIVDFFESTIGPYPFADEKLAAVETPHLGMEHQTINAYGNGYKAAPEGFDWLFQHELSHEWFGNQLTNRDWDEMWLHEGFGSYMQPLYARWKNGEMAYHQAMLKQRETILSYKPLVSGEPKTEEEVYENAKGPGGDIYVKGSWVLHTLRNLIGDDAFFTATRRLVYGRPDPRPGNFNPRFGTTKEFERYASEESGRNLGWFFDVYVYGAGLPELITRRDDKTMDIRWDVRGRRDPFPMPIDVRVDGETRVLPMTNGRGSITLPSPRSHVVFDPEGKILRYSPAIARLQEWQREQAVTTG